MNFVGRYYTVNGICVAVHKFDVEHIEIKFWGHELRLEAPYSDKMIFRWDLRGRCVDILNTAYTVSHKDEYDLASRVNPQSYAAGIECVDCEECRNEREAKLDPNRHKKAEEIGRKVTKIIEVTLASENDWNSLKNWLNNRGCKYKEIENAK